MIFVCNECGKPMTYVEQANPEQGSLNIVFQGPCERRCAFTMVTNPAETQMIGALGVKIGGKPLPEDYIAGAPLERLDNPEAGRHTAPDASGGSPVEWSEDAQKRMNKVPGFIRGMVKISYEKYARDHGITLMTPELMDQAREALGMQGM